MSYPAAITAFAQSVYLTTKNRYLDDIDDAEGQAFISQIIDFLNGYLDELEMVTDASGNVVNWGFLRAQDENLGSVAVGDNSIDIDDAILNVVATERRPLRIEVGGVVKSTWQVVSADQLNSDPSKRMVAKVGSTLFFSRVFNAQEDGGDIIADITNSITRASTTNSDALTTVKPKQLLILGVAKNTILPDIVQGGLTPTYVQKYNDLLQQVIMINKSSSDSDYVAKDDLSFIGGVY